MQVQDFLARYKQGERDFAHIDLSGAILTSVNLQDLDLTGANLTGANLSWSFLSRSKLYGACLRQADLRHTTLAGANLDRAILSGANLSKGDLRFAHLQEADLNWAVLEEADLSGADLQGAKLDQSNLERSKLNETQLTRAELMEANLRRSSLIGANFTNANLREANLESANLRDAILIGANLTEANLTGVCLRSANLSQADLHRVVLTGADLSEANLHSADLSRANLAGAYLLKTSLKKAYLLRTNLQDVLLLRSDLSEANLRGADLRRADLSGAYLSDTTLSESDLSEAYLMESHLIRTNLERAQMTGVCIENWHIEDVDLSKVECRYFFTQFNHATKSPNQRYPVGRDLEPGELAKEYREDSSNIEIDLTEEPNWSALIFTITKMEQDSPELTLTIKSFESMAGQYLLRLASNRLLNAKIVRSRFLQIYPQMLQRVLSRHQQILSLLNIVVRQPDSEQTSGETLDQPVAKKPPERPSMDKQMQVYQEVLRQIEAILMSQAPEQFVNSVERLIDYLKRQGISTEEIQKKVIGQAIARRAKRDAAFQEHLLKWEKTASDSARLSAVGSAVRLAIALILQQPPT
ncbi:pentapeptide repeat-containing protein [Argonema antarcticum]|uniref:pentapeptide repeat-containing protein n=1 Tax=Argonema antarcticum TaxID=2942763 RepID=UPI0020133920|nr:pentapeptide repeat-containing protein [Argonema antarcticum]MCL1471058.1 pentapeptide repeat-containing protein [Argonema antarcticum A004/B2]